MIRCRAGSHHGGWKQSVWNPGDPLGTPSEGTLIVIVQGHGQQPRRKKGLITMHLGPFLPTG